MYHYIDAQWTMNKRLEGGNNEFVPLSALYYVRGQGGNPIVVVEHVCNIQRPEEIPGVL